MASNYEYGEDAMMIDMAQPPSFPSPSEEAYYTSLHANYPGRSFRLWDLPRELRDAIYDYALEDQATFKVSTRPPPPPNPEDAGLDETPQPDDPMDTTQESEPSSPGIQATIKYRPSTNMLLASKLLKQEYEERAQNAMKITLSDHDRYAFQAFKLPEQATKVHNFELHLILFCHSCNSMSHSDEKTCHAALELNQHQLWIDKLLPELTDLRSLALHAYISHDRYRSESKLKIPCEKVVLAKFQEMRQVAKAKNLYLYKYDYNGHPDLDGPKATVWEWSAKDGVVKAEEVPASPAPKKADDGDPMDTDDSDASAYV